MIEEDTTFKRTWWLLVLYWLQQQLWAVDHWLLTHVHGLDCCSWCGGYFIKVEMAQGAGMCERCHTEMVSLEAQGL